MKSQLLADIIDSNPDLLPAAPAPTHTPSGQPAPPSPDRSGAPPQRTGGPGPKPRGAKRDSRVWRARSEPQPRADDWSAFETKPADLLMAQNASSASWYERWGRRAAIWTGCLAAAAGAIGAGIWGYMESKVDHTLAVVAGGSTTFPSTPDKAPLTAPAIANAPVAASPSAAAEAVRETGTETAIAPAAEEPKQEPAPPEPSRDVATVSTVSPETSTNQPSFQPKRSHTPPKTQAVKTQAVKTQAMKTHAVKTQTVQRAPARESSDRLAETLRQCRAAGYHATLCMRRRCTATPHGLVCKG